MDCVGVLRSEYGKVACKHEDLIQGADAIDKLLDPAVVRIVENSNFLIIEAAVVSPPVV